MFTSTQSIAGSSETGLPLRRRKFAHVALLLAWLAFWFNTAFIPCCEAFAAASDQHADDVAQIVPAASQMHDTHTYDAGHPHHAPASPCGPTLNLEPATNGEYAGLRADRVDFNCGATDMLVAANHIAENQSAKLALHAFRPPPRPREVRLYLQTQRLLI